jgi:hypothetical protein
MTNERIARALRSIREPVAPDPAFADRLFDQLVAEVDFRAGTIKRRGPLERLGRGLQAWRRSGTLPVPVALLLLLAGVVATVIFVGALLLGPRQLVERSHQLYRAMPPFEMTVDMLASERIVITYRYNGLGLLRGDVSQSQRTDLEVGSHFIFDGHAAYFFDPAGAYTHADGILGVPGGRPSSIVPRYNSLQPADRTSALALFPMTWSFPGQLSSPQPTVECRRFDQLGVEMVLGRPANHVACAYPIDAATDRLGYWIDSETGVILRFQSERGIYAATDLELMPAFDESTFALPHGPDGELPLNTARLEPGSYFTAHFAPTIVFRVPSGWYGGFERESDGLISSTGGEPYEAADDGHGDAALTPNGFDLTFARLDRLIEPVTGSVTPFNGSADDFVTWLRANPSLQVGASRNITLPGATGRMLDVTVTDSTGLTPCDTFPSEACLSLVETRDGKRIQLVGNSTARLAVLDTGTIPVLVVISGNLDNGALGVLQGFSFPR